VAVLVRWFPDKKGFITGLAVMGFGLGAAFMAIVGQQMIATFGTEVGVYSTFYIAGGLFLVGLLLAARKLINPPADYAITRSANGGAAAIESLSLSQAGRMPQLYILWGILFLNVAAGIALLSNLAYMATENLHLSAVAAGTVVMMGSFCNGFGRLFWGGLSEKIGRRNVFLLIFATQIPLFILLPQVHSYWPFALIACYILLCYGGGFGTMPSFTADTFGPKNIGAIYGVVLFAWGLAGGVGPGLMEWIGAKTGRFDTALYIAAGLLIAGLLLTCFYRKPRLQAANKLEAVQS
jgi:OFA family oxalate/formate antiporter-like MFS transporter